jgi:hypothetical protein
MKIIEYHRLGIAMADQDCEESARDFLLRSNGDDRIAISNSIFITAVRALICEGHIPHTEVQFIFDGQTLLPNKDGRMAHWPRGFCDYTDDLLMRILRMH